MTNELENSMQQPGMSIVITMPSSLEKKYKVESGTEWYINVVVY